MGREINLFLAWASINEILRLSWIHEERRPMAELYVNAITDFINGKGVHVFDAYTNYKASIEFTTALYEPWVHLGKGSLPLDDNILESIANVE